jgi:RpiR family transcriptional regulator, carbohydrate utilization regulator
MDNNENVSREKILKEYSQAVTANHDAISLIKRRMIGLNPALKRIAKYIIENTVKCKSMTIKELSEKCDVAESSITRFVREIGFSNYQELKIKIAESLTDKNNEPQVVEDYVYEDISKSDNIDTIFDKLIYRNISMLNETKLLLDSDQYLAAAKAIEQSDTVVFAGLGSSAIAAEEAIMRFVRAGVKCVFPRDNSMQTILSSIMTKKDVVIGISNSGKSVAVVKSVKQANANGVATIGITANPNSPLAKYSDIILLSSNNTSPSSEEKVWENTTSKISQLLVIDVLYAIYASRNYNKTKKYLSNTHESASHTREDY